MYIYIYTVLTVAELNEISVPDILFEEYVLDITDDVEEYSSCENSAVSDRLYSNGEISQLLREGQDGEMFFAAALEEAAAASMKPDKHFDMFKEATSTNSSQVQY